MLPSPEASDWLALFGGVGTIIAILWLIICAFRPRRSERTRFLKPDSQRSPEWKHAFDWFKSTAGHGGLQLSAVASAIFIWSCSPTKIASQELT